MKLRTRDFVDASLDIGEITMEGQERISRGNQGFTSLPVFPSNSHTKVQGMP